jgi:glycosyltransferase involved in cell wall biosynthesis
MFVIGEDWGERRNLQALARRLGLEKNVVFTGSISDVKLSHYLSKSDVFLLPSEYEGFGISAVVAMASGLPVIGSDIDAMREIITDGKNGFLLDYADSKKVAGTILSLIESKKARLRIGRTARIYSKRYDWPKIVRSLDKVYQRLQ